MNRLHVIERMIPSFKLIIIANLTYYYRHFFSNNLQRLVLFRCSVDDSDLSFISMCCPKLKSISLVDSGPVSDGGVSQ